MIKREMIIENLNLQYYIGIGRVKINYKDFIKSNNLDYNEKTILEKFFSKLDLLEKTFTGSTIQFIKDEFLINENHLLVACYHVQKAFINKINISNRKNLELLLYLSSNRQIKHGVKAFGIDSPELFSKGLFYCVISPINNVIEIKDTILKDFNGVEMDFELNYQNIDKYNKIMKYFQINEEQINVIINSRQDIQYKTVIDLPYKFEALYELICEKMAQLSLEKIKVDYA